MNNPLQTYFRQPSIYVKLPSDGEFWPDGSIDMGDNNEIGVYPMTARDEIIMKTPDALLSGKSTVEVIKSCCPQIKDPWQMPTLDLDTILIAIRIASYGENMSVSAETPVTKSRLDTSINLVDALDRIDKTKPDTTVILPAGLEVTLKPVTYRTMTQLALRVFDEQKMVQTVQDSSLSEEEKVSKYTETFNKVANYSVDEMLDCIVSVKTPDEKVITEPGYIKEFVQNIDLATAKQIREKITEIKGHGVLKPFLASSTEEDVKAGAPETFEVPISFDNSVFFG